MKKVISHLNCTILTIFLLGLIRIPVSAQTNEDHHQDPNVTVFMGYLQKHWDDMHDVIMRFHNEDPDLKGIVFIHMEWVDGLLNSATIDSNSTGNKEFGSAIIEAMKTWEITGLAENWVMTIPIRTAIYGSNHPEFHECGIFTGIVKDTEGNPVSGARLILTPVNDLNVKSDTVYTNREGIFIRTLIQIGNRKVECSKDDYKPTIIENLVFEKGIHIKKLIVLNRNT
ncbi:MAG: carboxypeptidase regulatory-like domain-containing protein [Bacteroidales bacterium]|nr:carboxypeptidase regulatory-like domain-containing protein [Bacteroidales bacterium]